MSRRILCFMVKHRLDDDFAGMGSSFVLSGLRLEVFLKRQRSNERKKMASYTTVGMLNSYIEGFPILEPTDEMYKKLSYSVQCFHFTPERFVHLRHVRQHHFLWAISLIQTFACCLNMDRTRFTPQDNNDPKKAALGI